ncbi:MAG: DNA polymerase IV [Balneolaceae bacterium]|nr:DNA polymerase IV [Balneolaceae bacterium]MCH8547987.1 DNA polymerase IV [Balneolaceae bacterium]
MDPNRYNNYDLEQDVHRITLYSTVAREHQHASLKKRLYLHLDMNCFYAQVEQLAYNLYGLPVAMGGWRKPNGTARGIVATASYEARALGIKTAMSAFEASQICPYLVFMQIDYDKYKGISRQLKEILDSFSPVVEKYSMDEYFIDITFLKGKPHRQIEAFGKSIKEKIYNDLGLVCSVGIAYSKTWSKLASDLKKPKGLSTILTADDAVRHLYPLPLDEVWGIGRRRYEHLKRYGLLTIADAVKSGSGPFKKLFGEMQGQLFWETVTGNDRARVLQNEEHIPDEVSYMHTFSDWTEDPIAVKGEIVKGVRKVCYRMRGYKRKARRWGCHIRYQEAHWEGYSFTFNTPGFTNLDDYVLKACLPEAMRVVTSALKRGIKIRGIGLHTIEMQQTEQMELFFHERDEVRHLYRAADCLNNCYGPDTVTKAAVHESVKGNTHFVNRS